ncbi:hypothetical protein SteCoe_10973 [Stentor coeruleus]|uniref:Uncharacterized protein n=1 Tax=Stentor coeruleus TaxID=5963 RepID=A0A1R2CE60_9CILI|nr:hypothetical protein SteCoe_10973 [Stentor coeruleus]
MDDSQEIKASLLETKTQKDFSVSEPCKKPEIKVMYGHTGPVTSLALHPSRTHLLSSSSDNTILSWDLVLKEKSQIFESHTAEVLCLSFDSYGNRFISGSADLKLKLWNFDSNELEGTYSGHTNPVTCVMFTKSEMSLISGSKNGTIIIHDIGQDEPVKTLTIHSDQINAFTLYERGILSASSDGKIKYLELDDYEEIFELDCGSPVLCLIMSNDKKLAYCGCEDFSVKVIDLESKKIEFTFTGHTGRVKSLIGLFDQKLLLSGSEDKSLKLWNLETEELEKSFDSGINNITSIVLRTSISTTEMFVSSEKSEIDCLSFNIVFSLANNLSINVSKGSENIWDESFTWEKCKRKALAELGKEENQHKYIYHRLAYNLQLDALKAKFEGQSRMSNMNNISYSILESKCLELTPIIFAIWGEEDRTSSSSETSLYLIERLIKICKEPKCKTLNSGDSSLLAIKGSFARRPVEINEKKHLLQGFIPTFHEWGHIYENYNYLIGKDEAGDRLEDSLLIDLDNKYSLLYRLEAGLVKLTKELLSEALRNKKVGVVDMMLRFIIGNISEYKYKPEKLESILQIIEGNLVDLIESNSTLLPQILDLTLQEDKKQIVVDQADLPLTKFDLPEFFSVEDLKNLAYNNFTDRPSCENIANTKIYYSLLKLPAISGSSDSYNLIKALDACENLELFRSRLIQYYLKSKWDSCFWLIFFQDSFNTISNQNGTHVSG